MSTEAFIQAKKIGNAFENAVANVLRSNGFEVRLNPATRYRDKQKYDFVASKGELRFTVEVKKDLASERTGNVCIELEALRHSEAMMFFLGLPNGDKTDIYAMPREEILKFAEGYFHKKHVGEWKVTAALIHKEDFLALPFLKKL